MACREDELEDRGVIVTSAGIAAMAGGGPTSEAVQVMADLGVDLTGHVTQPIGDRLVRHADVILDHDAGASAGITGPLAGGGGPDVVVVRRSASTWPTPLVDLVSCIVVVRTRFRRRSRKRIEALDLPESST